jgi:hypothetical protein
VEDGVGPPRPPAGRGVGVGAAERGQRPAQREVAGQPHVGVAQAAQAHEPRGPGADARDGEQRAAGLVAIGTGVEGDVPAGQCRGERGDGATAGAGEPDRNEVGLGQGGGAGKGVGEGADRFGQRSARGRDQSRGEGAGAGDRDLLAQDRPDGELVGVGGSGHAPSGRGGDQARQGRVGAEDVVHRGRIGVQVEHPAAAGDGGTEVAEVGQPQPRGDRGAAGAAGGEPDDGGTVRQVEHAGERRSVPLLQAGDGVRAEEQQHLVRRVRRAGRQAQGEPAGGAVAGCPFRAAQAAGGRGEDLAHGVVELPDAGEAGGEGDVGHRQVGGLDQQPRRLRAPRPGQGQRADSEFAHEQPVQLALRVAQAGGQARDAGALDLAVRDEPHGAGDDVGPHVPLGGPRNGVRPAPAAGAEAGVLGGRRGGEEGDVAGQRSARRARRAAVDAGGVDGGDEPAVETGVPAGHRAVAALDVQHLGHGIEHASRERRPLAVFGRRRHGLARRTPVGGPCGTREDGGSDRNGRAELEADVRGVVAALGGLDPVDEVGVDDG